MPNLVAIPVYNEAETVPAVLDELRRHYGGHVLFIDDGSRDSSPCILSHLESDTVSVIQHRDNRGYGRALRSAFNFATQEKFSAIVTMDADWQHEPRMVPVFFEALLGFDVVSGSRYLEKHENDDDAPADRRSINGEITKQINHITGYNITDAFCGFKAYDVKALSKLSLDEDGYSMPLQFWIQAKHFGFNVKEIAVPRIYSDPKRQFAGPIKDPDVRRAYYQETIVREVARWGV